VNIKQMLKNGNLHEDPHLHPGDMLVVPRTRSRRFNATSVQFDGRVYAVRQVLSSSTRRLNHD